MAQPKAKKKKRRKIRTTDPFKAGFWKKHWTQALIVGVLSIALYVVTTTYEFVLDDQMVVTDNAFTKQGLDGIGEIFSNDSFTGYFGEQKDLVEGARYRPLSIATFAVEYELAELNPMVYHATNVVLYGLLCLLVFRVISVFFHDRKPAMWFFSIPFIGALLFAMHPIHSEVIANVKGRDEILALLLSLASLYAAMRYFKRKSPFWLAAVALLFFAGLMAKENTLTFLAVIPLALYFFLFSKGKLRQSEMLRTLYIVLAAILAAGAYIIIRLLVIGYLFAETETVDLLNNPFIGMTIAEKSATVMYTLGHYVKLLFIPHPLTHDYYPYHIPIMHWGKPMVLLSLLTYIALILVALAGVRRRWVVSFSILYFFATLSIVSNVFFTVGTFMNERFVFMPSFGYCVAIAFLAVEGHKRMKKTRWLIPALVALYVSALTVKSIERIPAWKDPLSLNTAAVAVSENSARANCFMGTALYNQARETENAQERIEIINRAETHIDKSLSIIPNYLSANQMKSGIIAEHYRYDRDLDKLLKGFEEILSRKPNVQYIQQYAEYMNGRDLPTQKLLDFYYRVGYEILYKEQRRYDYATIYLNYGLQLDPEHPVLNWAIGKVLTAWGDVRADRFLTKAYTLDPSLRNRPE